MLLVYSKQVTPRINYAFDLIFKDILRLDYGITADIEEFQNFSGPKLNYSSSRIGNEFYIEPAGLLTENNIESKALPVTEWNGTKIFFKTSGRSDMPFDLFSASFYLVTRYEEYLPFEHDKHDRFRAEESISYKNNFLHKPMVNIWAGILKQMLHERFPDLVIPAVNYEYISTFDLDNVYCYKGKSFFRNAGGAVKSMLKFDFYKIAERINVLSGKINDPFDHYDFHRKTQEQYGFPIIYFLLFAKKTGFDGAVSPKSKAYKTLIDSIKEYAQIGLHPSYYSNVNSGLLKNEIQNLREVSQLPITKSRQHFLKITFPSTYQNLIESGITEDYSMGYQSHPGFRAGICTPFFFYDLTKESVTGLKIFPFSIMDSAMYDYLKISPDKAFQHIKPIVDEVKNVNGTMISIWHDRTFSNIGIYKGWKELFIEMVKIAHKK